MESQNTFESLLKEFLTPIIENALENVLIRNKALFQQSGPVESSPNPWSIKEVAEYIRLSVPTVYGLVHRRAIPNYKVGKRLYFRKEDLDKWIARGRRMTIDEIDGMADQYITTSRKKYNRF